MTQVDRRTASLGKAAVPAVPSNSRSGLSGLTSLRKTMKTYSTSPGDSSMSRVLPLGTDRSEREPAPTGHRMPHAANATTTYRSIAMESLRLLHDSVPVIGRRPGLPAFADTSELHLALLIT